MSRLDPEILRRDVEALFESPPLGAGGPSPSGLVGSVGIEVELVPVGRAGGLPGPDSDAILDRLASGIPAAGRFTFEPGGQLEYSGPVCATLARAVADVERTGARLRAAAEEEGIRLESRGLAPWFAPEDVGLRRPKPRYREMDRYFARLGPWGPWMMRLSASLQVNLDFGTPAEAPGRWRTANALGPILVAVFANSPADLPDGTPVTNGRWWVWRRVDPARTAPLGRAIPGGEIGAVLPPWTEYLAFALTAPVMFDAATRPVVLAGREAPPFRDWWMAGGAAGPTEADWRAHLGALFPDVRPRRWMEIRSVDVPRPEWWPVPPALLAALLYDERARTEADERLDGLVGRAGSRSEYCRRAIRDGLGDGELRAAAADVFEIAESALGRFPAGWVGARARTAVAAFRERFVSEGRTQADEAREAGEVARLGATTASLPPRSS